MSNASLLRQIKKYEGKTVEDFFYSDIVEWVGIDVYKVNGHEIGCGEDYVPDHRTIHHIEIRNVMGYMIADVTTEEVGA